MQLGYLKLIPNTVDLYAVPANLPCDVDDMLMVGEVDRLSLSADPFHHAAGRSRTFFVKGLKDIITEER